MGRNPKVVHARARGVRNRRRALCGVSGTGLRFRSGDGVTCTLCLIVAARGGDQ